MSKYKVLVDSSVLIAASLKCVSFDLGYNIQDHFYKISKPLLEYFESNIDKRIGIVTADIESSSRERIRKALFRALEKNKPTKKDILKTMESYSKIFSIIDKELNRNLGFLVREPINEKAVKKISFKVSNFYYNLIARLKKLDPHKTINRATYFAPKGFRGLVRDMTKKDEKDNLHSFRVLKRKLEENPPDMNDIRILSQAQLIELK